jgi:hypothetical protein
LIGVLLQGLQEYIEQVNLKKKEDVEVRSRIGRSHEGETRNQSPELELIDYKLPVEV